MNHTIALTTSAALLVLSGLPAYSQTTFATITATNRNTKVRTTAQSNRAGNYTMDTLEEGSYDVDAAAPGFKRFVVENVILGSRDERRLMVPFKIHFGIWLALAVRHPSTLWSAQLGSTNEFLYLN